MVVSSRLADDTCPALPMLGEPHRRSDAVENQQRILCAARKMVNEHGAQALTMQAVASAAGVGKATVSHRFGDRDGLLRALLDDFSAELQDAFLHGPPPLGPGAPAAQRLEAFMTELVRQTIVNLGAALAGESLMATEPPPAYGVLRLHVSLLIREVNPALPPGPVAAFLLNAVAPSVLSRLLGSGETDEAGLMQAARALVRGLDADRADIRS